MAGDRHWHIWSFSRDYSLAVLRPVRFSTRTNAQLWGYRVHGPAGGFVRLCDRPDSCGVEVGPVDYWGPGAVGDVDEAFEAWFARACGGLRSVLE